MDVRLISAVFVCLFSFLHTAPAHSATDLNSAINSNAANEVTYVDARSFGAVGDGVADDTAAIQKAINEGKRIYLPGTSAYYKISSALTLSSSSSIAGDGLSSQIRQITPGANVISGTSVKDVVITGLNIYGPGDASSDATGNGIYLAGSSRVSVEGNRFENIGNTGIHLKDTTYSQIVDNEMVSFVHYRQDSADIALKYSSSYNTVSGNKCVSGSGTGILVQAIKAGDGANYNVIESNLVTAHDRYGIVLYAVNGATAADVIGNTVIGNTVKDISDVTATYFGAGIYAQGVRQTTIADNHVENTNNGTTNEMLAPGGIGVTGSSQVTVTGNTVENAKWYGITLRDPFGIGGDYTVTGNTVLNPEKTGIYAIASENVTISGNTVSDGNSHGIHLFSSTGTSYAQIVGNTVEGNAKAGVNSAGYSHVTIKDNTASSNGTHGISVQNGAEIDVEGNRASGNKVRGIDINSGNSLVRVIGNTAESNAYGIVKNESSAQVTFSGNVFISNTTVNWSGVPFADLPDGGSTPTVPRGAGLPDNPRSVEAPEASTLMLLAAALGVIALFPKKHNPS